MCYDICVRALHDTIVTMRYMEYRQRGSKESVDTPIREILEHLQGIKGELLKYEGRHSSLADPCPVCDVYQHHNHPKTEWRSVDDISRDYDNNLLVLGDDIDEKTVSEIFKELKNRFKISVTPVRLSKKNKEGHDNIQAEVLGDAGGSPLESQDVSQLEKGKRFLEALPVWGLVIDRDKRVIDRNRHARQMGVKTGDLCYPEITGRSTPCTWCRFDSLLASPEQMISSNVSVKYHPQTGLVEDPEGSLKDAHWVRLDESHYVHFGSVQYLNRFLKEELLKNMRTILGVVPPSSFFQTIGLPAPSQT